MPEITAFTPWSALGGGALIGLGAVVLMGSLGRVAGISGIFANTFRPGVARRSWPLGFVLGMIISAGLVYWLWPAPFVPRQDFPWWALILGGLLVGFGTALGSGCTSGHGVCGLARLSPRSLVATGVFLLTGMLTASVLRGVLGL